MWLSESFVTLTLTLWSKTASQFSHWTLRKAMSQQGWTASLPPIFQVSS